MKQTKRFLALLLAFSMCLSMITPAYASEIEEEPVVKAAPKATAAPIYEEEDDLDLDFEDEAVEYADDAEAERIAQEAEKSGIYLSCDNLTYSYKTGQNPVVKDISFYYVYQLFEKITTEE